MNISIDETEERARLESIHGKTWDTQELLKQFRVLGFTPKYCFVEERSTGIKGTVAFRSNPLVYFRFMRD